MTFEEAQSTCKPGERIILIGGQPYKETERQARDTDRARKNAIANARLSAESRIDFGKNPQILAWWKPYHDEVVRATIAKWQWCWDFHVTNAIVQTTPKEVIEAWKSVHSYAPNIWYNTLGWFAQARAEEHGWLSVIRAPQDKTCLVCGCTFNEMTVTHGTVVRFGIDGLDFCMVCVRLSLYSGGSLADPGFGSNTTTRDEALTYLQRLSDALQRVPAQVFGNGEDDFKPFSRDERLKILMTMRNRPSARRVKELFGSWLKALIAAGVLEGDVRRTSRGTQCVAKDGHVCLSLAEKTIDDTLFELGLPHTKEPRYPASNYRADFAVGELFIEYYGLAGQPEYDRKCEIKRAVAKRHGIRVIEIYPKDVISKKSLLAKLASARAQVSD